MYNYRETIYTCPGCGTSFTLPEYGELLSATAPHLLCPRCGATAYRTSADEQYTLQTYHRYREETRAIIARLRAKTEAAE